MSGSTSTDGAALLLRHRDLLARLPVTFRAFVGVEVRKWPTLFEAEKAYLTALLDILGGPEDASLLDAFAGVMRLETESGCGHVRETEPQKLLDATQALLRRKGLLPRWRREIDDVFRHLQPRVEARLHPADSPHRLVVMLYGSGIAIQRDKLWGRFRGLGTRVPLRLHGLGASSPFLRALFARGAADTLFTALRGSAGLGPHESWIVDAGDAFAGLCEAPGGRAPACATWLSYVRLRAYREMLARSLYEKVQSGVSGPQEMAAYARALDPDPPPDALPHTDATVRSFSRDVLLSGNGTLLVNNTFVEWTSVQALKRAEPRLLVARFGVRDRMKAFSSLLLFSGPRPTDQVSIVEDPFGSFIDVEQLSYYVWLNAEKSAAFRGKTLYVLLAEGVDEMLAVRSGTAEIGELPEATLADVAATMAAWLGVPAPPSGRPIAGLL
jgi:hypothetical protein